MSATPPPPAVTNIEGYVEWAKGPIGIDFAAPEIKLAYKQNVTFIQTTAQDHDFFTNLETFLKDSSQAYLEEMGAELFMGDLPSLKLIVKPYESVINKSFRYNVLENDNFPAPPPADWASPNNWFSKFDDTVRSTIVCKFIDGPRFLAERLKEYATGYGLLSRFASKQKDDGYYAYHYYVKLPVELFLSGAPTVVDVEIEIQLSTQLQDVMYGITHRYYEGLRIQKEADPSAWKWEVGSNRFRAGYLSHTLHLLEGIILELRNGGRQSVGADEMTQEPGRQSVGADEMTQEPGRQSVGADEVTQKPGRQSVGADEMTREPGRQSVGADEATQEVEDERT